MPPDPSWWPPAVGWWILAVLVVIALCWAIMIVINAYRARRPLRLARAQHAVLYANLGQASPLAYVAQTNELLKRLLVHALGRTHYSPLSGEDWLKVLDQESNSIQFSSGPGAILGHARFARQPDFDAQALHGCVSDLLRSVKVNHD